MGKVATVARENIYYKARLSASKYAKCSSRETASELLDIERTRMAKIETDKLEAYPEEVMKMAEAYNAPNAKDVLLKILEDGQITDDEIEVADQAITTLTKLMKDVVNLKIALEKIKR